jgi:hypothetical protein
MKPEEFAAMQDFIMAGCPSKPAKPTSKLPDLATPSKKIHELHKKKNLNNAFEKSMKCIIN